MDLIITMLNGSHTLRVNPRDTVGSLKLSIQLKFDIPVEKQKLVFVNGEKTLLNEDSRTLGSYGLQSGSQVSLLVTEPAKIQVFLKNEKGQTSTYDITADEPVSSFRARVEQREKVPADQQRLIHEGREMSGGKLSDYGVRALSTIYLTLRLRGG